MKRQIRNNVFETNSSSTHSMTICMEDDFDKWSSGEYLRLENSFLPEEEARKKNVELLQKYSDASEEEIQQYSEGNIKLDELVSRWDLIEYYHSIIEEDNSCGEVLDYFEDTYTTRNGDKVVAFGYYGYDG